MNNVIGVTYTRLPDCKILFLLRLLGIQLNKYTCITSESCQTSLCNFLASYDSQFNSKLCPRQWFLHLTMADGHVSVHQWRSAVAEVSYVRRNAATLSVALKSGSIASGLCAACCAHLDSYIGCLFLQIGSLENAERAFTCAQKWFCVAHNDFKICLLWTNNMRLSKMSQVLNKSMCWPFSSCCSPFLQAALIAFTRHNYPLATRLFDWASRDVSLFALMTGPAVELLSSISFRPDSDSHDIAELYHLSSESINNLVICSLHACDLETAVSLLERQVCSDPRLHLSRVVAFNLCTLYDLSTESCRASMRKRVLQQVAVRFWLANMECSVFRLC